MSNFNQGTLDGSDMDNDSGECCLQGRPMSRHYLSDGKCGCCDNALDNELFCSVCGVSYKILPAPEGYEDTAPRKAEPAKAAAN